jgi:hypothetical protein
VASFVRELPSIDNLESVGAKVFNSTTDGRVNRFKQAVNYFLNGTREQYGRHKNATLRNFTSEDKDSIIHLIFFLLNSETTQSS